MKQITSIILGCLALLAMPITSSAGLLGIGDGNKVATAVAELNENTQAGVLDFSPDGKYLAVFSQGNGGTDIWNIEQKRVVAHLPEGGVYTIFNDLISFSPNGKQFAICNEMTKISVYETSSWTKINSIDDAELKQHQSGGCQAIAFTPDGKELIRLASPSIRGQGNNVIFYDTFSWQITRGFRTGAFVDSNSIGDPINWSVQVPPNTILIDPSNNKTSFDPHTLSISKDGKYLALAGSSIAFDHESPFDQSEVVIVEISNQSLVHVIHGQAESPDHQLPVDITSIDWSHDSNRIAFGPIDNSLSIKVLDSSSNKTVATEGAEPFHVLVRYTSDGKYLIEKIEKRVEIWDGQHQKLLQVIKAEPTYIAVSRDGHYFAMGGAENSILDATALLSLITHPNGPKGKVLVYKLE
jgi:WD40 repeat protein